ncbi:MAG: lipocalin-like domain-containing protein [Gammaproteobacteria bacterium]
MNGRALALTLGAITFALVVAWLMLPPDGGRDDSPGVARLLGDSPSGEFAQATEPGAIRFPADHGPHPDYRTEWWYVTGNLRNAAGRHFGFQITFFRFALAVEAPERDSAWAADQVYMAHFAVTDTAGRRHIAAERFDRAALGLAGAKVEPFRVWLGDWSAASAGKEFLPLRLNARDKSMALDLTLTTSKPVVLNGDAGLSRKGPAPGDASYYYSFTRLAASGGITVDGESFDVEGRAWLDREWSSGALGEHLSGWDWFALQLDDGTDIMFYRLRRKDGDVDPFSAGSLVAADGSRRALGAHDVTIESSGSWTSPDSGVTYPMGWRLRLPNESIVLDVQPYVEAQEMDLSVRYWEGAVRVAGGNGGKAATGEGYVELAGYGEEEAAGLGR